MIPVEYQIYNLDNGHVIDTREIKGMKELKVPLIGATENDITTYTISFLQNVQGTYSNY